MANEDTDESWDIKLRQDTEQEFFTELALHEAERWIQAVTRKKFQYSDDFRKSLENGILLCELLNSISPGSVKRINKLPTPLAGLDNINVFLDVCKKKFGLKDNQLFDSGDLEDLSQRAISQSEHSLQQEVDRRNTNVAIAIYWLGRTVESSFNGPHLDQSAFAALVNIHRKDLISDKPLHHDSLECSGYSSAYSSHDGKDGRGDSVDRKHNRDSSYDSFGSYGHSRESSLTEENMPVGSDMRRYGSTSSLNKNSELRLSSNLDSFDGLHQSTPDLSNAHTRTSSVDSYEDSYGSHSRQSSDSVDIPTRTLKSQRRTSQSEDPMKFVKLRPSKDLAKQAIEQITMVKEEKQVRKTEFVDDQDWQSNLSSWKNRRRRVSAAAYERVEGTDDLIRDDEEKRKTKTYEQIRQERDKRKSTGQLNFYPIEDDESLTWSVKAPTKQSTVITERITRLETSKTEHEPKRAPMLSSQYRSKSMGSAYVKPDIAPWAGDNENGDNTNSKSKTESSRTLDENHNADKPTIRSESARRLSNKFSNIMKSFESKEENDSTPVFEKPRKTFEFSVDSKSERFKDSKVLDTQTARSTLQTKKKQEPAKPRNYVEKNIKIKQKPYNSKGFGITVVGGQDKKQPVVIEKVNIGSAADVCEVQMKDEILSINNRDIGIMTQAMVRKVIEDANKKGELELRVRRYTTNDDSCEEDDEDEDDDAFHPPTTRNPEKEFSAKSFEPSRTSSRISETSTTQESTWSRSSYQPSGQRRESPSVKETSPESKSVIETSQRSRKTESSTTPEPSRWSRSTHEFSARTRTTPERKQETPPPSQDIITTTTSHVTETSRRREIIKTEVASPPSSRRNQLENNFNSLEDNEENNSTSIMSELDKEKQWIMEQMAGKDNSEKEEEVETTVPEPIEEQIIQQTRKTEESSYQRTYGRTREPVRKPEEVPVQHTLPSHEVMEEEKPTIRVHRSRQNREVPTPQTREIPITVNKPEINHIELPSQPQQKVDNDLSPSQTLGGFGPPEILRRWQRPRPRSEYSSSGSLNDDKRLSASMDSPSSSPRFPEEDVTQNHINGSKPQVVVGQPVTLEIRPEQPVRQAYNMSAPPTQISNQAPTLVIDPRNKMDNSDTSLPQYNFHFNINDKNTKENDQVRYDLEAERERIRQEEKERLEEERRQWEEEEQRKLYEKEARLREEEEKLQREKQRIEEMKASMEREKMELDKKQSSDVRNNDDYNIHRNDYNSDKFHRSRPENNHQFSAYADSNSRPRSLNMSSSWKPREVNQQRENLSREDMLLMNRTAKPFARLPENEQSQDTSDNHLQQHEMSREDIHSLNYAPKPKIRSSQDWIQNSDSGSKHSSRSESPNEHWLVEEAERRRKSGHTSNYQSGPIKPKSDIISNRWQDDRHGQPPRSLSPQNTRSYEFKQFSARPQNKLNQTLPANFNMGNMKSKTQPPVPAPKPNRTYNNNLSSSVSSSTRSSSNLSSPVSPSSPKSHAEQVVAVSGRQLCSHCSQELGFGAAMVIESLGLYYHVQCFRCCVCHSTLGNGVQGADVRVRVNKLHCRNCYSNDEAGLKFSKV